MTDQQPFTADADATITHRVTFQCTDDRGLVGPLGARLHYDTAHPFAVSVIFHTGSGDVAWEFGRDLLIDGLQEPVGAGDVHLWPYRDQHGVASLVLELISSDGQLVARAPAEPAHDFVRRTLRAVPRGTESLDVDEVLEQLLGP